MINFGPASSATAPVDLNLSEQPDAGSVKVEGSTCPPASTAAVVKAQEAPISVSSSPVSSGSPVMPIVISIESDVPASPASVAEAPVDDMLLGPTSDDPRYKHALLIAGTLKKRLAYAHYKVQNGWENESFENVKKWTDEKYAKLSDYQKRKAAGLAKKKLALFADSDSMFPRRSRVIGTATVKVVKESTSVVSEELSPVSEAEKLDLKRMRKSAKNYEEDDASLGRPIGTRKKARAGNLNEDTLLSVIDDSIKLIQSGASESPAPAPSQMNLASSTSQQRPAPTSNKDYKISSQASSSGGNGRLSSSTPATGSAYNPKMSYAPPYSHYPSYARPSPGSGAAGPRPEYPQPYAPYPNTAPQPGNTDYTQVPGYSKGPKGAYPSQVPYGSMPSMGPHYGSGRLPPPAPVGYGQPPRSSYPSYPYHPPSSHSSYRPVSDPTRPSSAPQAPPYGKPSSTTQLPPPRSAQPYAPYSSSQYHPSTDGGRGMLFSDGVASGMNGMSTRLFPPPGGPTSSQPYPPYTARPSSMYGPPPPNSMDPNGYYPPYPPSSGPPYTMQNRPM
ncbi:hypothetical protein BDR26DRAFT_1006658 [Obelidium mucronatum]|nr:hypothetical protein BDR26DRAFT_1006658 [Obelidium mucronatum]